MEECLPKWFWHTKEEMDIEHVSTVLGQTERLIHLRALLTVPNNRCLFGTTSHSEEKHTSQNGLLSHPFHFFLPLKACINH